MGFSSFLNNIVNINRRFNFYEVYNTIYVFIILYIRVLVAHKNMSK